MGLLLLPFSVDAEFTTTWATGLCNERVKVESFFKKTFASRHVFMYIRNLTGVPRTQNYTSLLMFYHTLGTQGAC